MFPLAAAIAASGQTQVDLRTQSRNVDFSGASMTKPARTGTTLPGVCTVGELFFKLDALAGQNIHACTSLNTWTAIVGTGGGGGGGGEGAAPTSASALLDLKVERTSGAVLTAAAGCTPATPCHVRFGNRVESINAGATATLSGSASGIGFFYVSNQGLLTIGYDAITVACNSGCVAVNGVTSFPADSIPVATWTVTAGVWDVNGGLDFRGFLSTKAVSASTGLVTTELAGLTTLSVDTTMVGLRVAVPGSAASACVQGSWAADTSFHYVCVAANTWRRASVTTW
jgi:hypothetical protein